MKNLVVVLMCAMSFVCNNSYAQKNSNEKLDKVVILADSLYSGLALTIVDNIPYIHEPERGPMVLMNPEEIKSVTVIKFETADKKKYKSLDKYKKYIKGAGFIKVTTKKGKGL